MYCNVYDGRRRLLLRQGYVINSQTQIDAVVGRGVFFIFNEEDITKFIKQVRPFSDVDSLEAENELSLFIGSGLHGPIPKRSPFELIDEAHSRLETLYSAKDPGKNLPATVGRLCRLIQQACHVDKDASLSTILLQQEGRYSVKHSIHTAITCEVVLKQMGYTPRERLSILAAGLTMNIAMSQLQDELFFQKEKPTEEQQEKIKAHLYEGVKILLLSGVSDPLWVKTVLHHHEFPDGTGYPQKLQGEALDETSRILTIADIYTAKVAGRAYRKPMPPNVALKEIFCRDRGRNVDMDLSHLLIKEMGIYPPGSFVRLENGEIAVVTHSGEKANTPIVCSIVRPNGDLYLNPKFRESSDKLYTIKEVISPADTRLSVNRCQLWGYGA